MPSVSGILGDGKTQFKWHIEPGHPRGFRVKLNAREVVDRIRTLLEKFQYSLKPALARGDFQGRTGYESKRAQTRDVGQI